MAMAVFAGLVVGRLSALKWPAGTSIPAALFSGDVVGAVLASVITISATLFIQFTVDMGRKRRAMRKLSSLLGSIENFAQASSQAWPSTLASAHQTLTQYFLLLEVIQASVPDPSLRLQAALVSMAEHWRRVKRELEERIDKPSAKYDIDTTTIILRIASGARAAKQLSK